MQASAQTGTRILWLALALVVACDEGSNKKQGDTPDSSAAGSCQSATDCALVGTGCCGQCTPTKSGVVAVPKGEVSDEEQRQCPPPRPACGPCEVKPYDPLAPYLQAGCEQDGCVVIDLREQDATKCQVDADCKVEPRGCCEPCTGNPAQWIALSANATNPAATQCDTTRCPECATPLKPLAFCAADGHCALRTHPSVRGIQSTTCYSPNQNIDAAYSPGSQGCDCFEIGASLCIRDSTGRDVALVCEEQGYWRSVEDGACEPGG